LDFVNYYFNIENENLAELRERSRLKQFFKLVKKPRK